MKKGQAYVLVFIAVALAVVVLGAAYYNLIPLPPPPPPPGPEPEVTVQTDVKLINPLLGNPYISEINNQIVAQPYAEPKMGVAIFPWEGTLVLKVIYPSGQEVTVGSQKVSIDLGADMTVTFFWKTKQSGDHTVVATLYDKNGVLTDQKSVKVYVPPR